MQLPKISTPAKRALATIQIEKLEDLQKVSRENILKLHGVGKNTILPLDDALRAHGIWYKE